MVLSQSLSSPHLLEAPDVHRRWTSRIIRLRLALLTTIGVLVVTVAWHIGAPAEVNAQSAQPVLLASGQFGAVDSFHKGEGKALVLQLPDGRRFLRFEDFRVTNGPDLYVYLSGHPAPRNREQLHQGAALEVARLKGNIGNQNYELPADLDLSRFKSAVIYCKRFSVVFSTAELISRP